MGVYPGFTLWAVKVVSSALLRERQREIPYGEEKIHSPRRRARKNGGRMMRE